LAIDPSKRNITIFDKKEFLLQVDTLSDYSMARWLSADPYGQFSSPYVGMGNRPNMSTDPDGGWSWITAGIGFAVGAGAAALSGNGDDWWKWGLAGGLAGGASFNQTRLPFNSFSNYSITASSFGSSIGNAFSGAGRFIGNNSGIITGAARSYLSTYQSSSKWKTVGSASLPYVGQAPYAEWCVYACGQSVDSWLGGSRTASDFAKWQNGGVALDKGPGTEGAWFKFWQKNFPSNYVNAGSSGNPLDLPSSSDIISGLNNNQVYSVGIHESNFPAGYDHNVLIQSVEQHVKSGKYRYVLMDPNGVRSIPEKHLKLVHQRHLIIKR